MIQSNELKGKIIAKGFTQKEMADLIGVSEKTFNYKLNNKGEFTLSEAKKIIELLDIKEPLTIFFC